VSTEDDRPRHAGEYASGSYARGSDSYRGSGFGPSSDQGTSAPGTGMYDEGGYSSAETTELPSPSSSMYDAPSDEEVVARRRPGGWHPGADLGLLVLRVALGGLFVAHGLRSLFGLFGGGGISDVAETMTSFGFSSPTLLAWVTGVSELAGGTLVLLGLFTPAGAAMILGVMANVVIVKFNADQFVGGVELEWIYGGAALALLFTGPGRISLDRPTPWYRNATAFGGLFLVITAGAVVATQLVFR
jgi:putative oxidoreductase